MRLFRQAVHAFNVTDGREARLFDSTLSLTVGARSQQGLEGISATMSGLSDGGVGRLEKGGRLSMACRAFKYY